MISSEEKLALYARHMKINRGKCNGGVAVNLVPDDNQAEGKPTPLYDLKATA
jgi:hypothetical protein